MHITRQQLLDALHQGDVTITTNKGNTFQVCGDTHLTGSHVLGKNPTTRRVYMIPYIRIRSIDVQAVTA